jgi:hypothetical protein
MNPPQALFSQLPSAHTSEEFERILEADFAANHQGREYGLDFVKGIMERWQTEGRMLFFAPSVVFVIEEKSEEVAEFHSINGGSGRDLSTAVNAMLPLLAQFYSRAVTYYDNPRVNDLLKYSAFPASYRRLDEGRDRTFEATFHLRG